MDTQSKASFTVHEESLEVEMSRIFDAPRELVWKVLTDPSMVSKWWGPRIYTTTVDKMDVRVGGVWRFIQKDKDGNEFAFNGVYKEIVPNEKLVNTFEFEPMPGHILTETATLEDHDGKTLMKAVSHYANMEDLKGMVASGMEGGAVESWERLAELLATVK
jgi:uncharacterized protein YndB with AHSA1/START domain